ncbi:unnamed protein product [Ambrosiozyma monospora]|uniref:Unnamed protein product n=1 Tax=Ambrosiozyma monospora TaxID=43982 RepID=A0ACB5SQS6_AMBMO|nr:unnamed protein product [Ambrosiozyma monospora]
MSSTPLIDDVSLPATPTTPTNHLSVASETSASSLDTGFYQSVVSQLPPDINCLILEHAIVSNFQTSGSKLISLIGYDEKLDDILDDCMRYIQFDGSTLDRKYIPEFFEFIISRSIKVGKLTIEITSFMNQKKFEVLQWPVMHTLMQSCSDCVCFKFSPELNNVRDLKFVEEMKPFLQFADRLDVGYLGLRFVQSGVSPMLGKLTYLKLSLAFPEMNDQLIEVFEKLESWTKMEIQDKEDDDKDKKKTKKKEKKVRSVEVGLLLVYDKLKDDFKLAELLKRFEGLNFNLKIVHATYLDSNKTEIFSGIESKIVETEGFFTLDDITSKWLEKCINLKKAKLVSATKFSPSFTISNDSIEDLEIDGTQIKGVTSLTFCDTKSIRSLSISGITVSPEFFKTLPPLLTQLSLKKVKSTVTTMEFPSSLRILKLSGNSEHIVFPEITDPIQLTNLLEVEINVEFYNDDPPPTVIPYRSVGKSKEYNEIRKKSRLENSFLFETVQSFIDILPPNVEKFTLNNDGFLKKFEQCPNSMTGAEIKPLSFLSLPKLNEFICSTYHPAKHHVIKLPRSTLDLSYFSSTIEHMDLELDNFVFVNQFPPGLVSLRLDLKYYKNSFGELWTSMILPLESLLFLNIVLPDKGATIDLRFEQYPKKLCDLKFFSSFGEQQLFIDKIPKNLTTFALKGDTFTVVACGGESIESLKEKMDADVYFKNSAQRQFSKQFRSAFQFLGGYSSI